MAGNFWQIWQIGEFLTKSPNLILPKLLNDVYTCSQCDLDIITCAFEVSQVIVTSELEDSKMYYPGCNIVESSSYTACIPAIGLHSCRRGHQAKFIYHVTTPHKRRNSSCIHVLQDQLSTILQPR